MCRAQSILLRHSLKKELVATVREVIGPIATPDVIHWAPGTHKTLAFSLQCRHRQCHWCAGR